MKFCSFALGALALVVVGCTGPMEDPKTSTDAWPRAAAAEALTVDLGTDNGPVAHSALGFINSITAVAPSDDRVTDLGAWMWRNGRPGTNGTDAAYDALALYPRLKALGITHYEVLVSDYGKLAPWKSMTPYDRSRAIALKAQSEGKTDIVWDILNEPDGLFGSSSYYADWKAGRDGIKSVFPNAVIVGPSLYAYRASNLQGFLSYCQVNGCLPDYVTWHALGTGGSDAADTLANINAMKQYLSSRSMAVKGCIINEYTGMASNDNLSPGVAAWYWKTSETTKSLFLHASWYSVGGDVTDVNPVLDGLLTMNGARRMTWYWYQAYGALGGTLVSTGTSANYTGISAWNSAAVRAVSLVGDKTPSGSGTLSVTYTHVPAALVNGGQVLVTVRHYALGSAAVSGPTVLTQGTYPVSAGTLTVAGLAVGAGAGVEVILTRKP